MGASPFRGFLLCSTDASLPVTFNVNHVQRAFDLTQTETSIVNSIGRGLTNPEIADRRGRSVSTINAQTKSILSKTGCSNRTQFVRMMMRYGGSFLTSEV
nr:LuxR C-terminal-related transcriptional regulator [Ruegeria sp. Ofav3-42]